MNTNTLNSARGVAAECALVRATHGIAAARPGVLRLSGRDSTDFLQRMSTNDFSSFAGPQTTLFLSEKGKIIDIVTAVPRGPQILLFTSEGRDSQLEAWLRRYIIMEEIELANVTSLFTSYYVLGPESGQKILSFVDELRLNTAPVTFTYALSKLPWHLVAVEGSFHEPDEELVSRECCETLRIEEGIPSVSVDCDERTQALEVDIRPLISFSKGCYVGQEVVARLDTYQKTARKFTGFLMGGNELFGRGDLFAHDQAVGFTTSHCWSPLMNQNVALGYVKTTVQPDTVLSCQEAGRRFTVKTVTLPFRPHGG